MRKQTNLAKVKQTALTLLSTEINETPYSPMIVKHPFTDTGVSAIPDGKGGVEMIDLTEDDAQLRWRQSMARQIDKADNAYAIYNCSQSEFKKAITFCWVIAFYYVLCFDRMNVLLLIPVIEVICR